MNAKTLVLFVVAVSAFIFAASDLWTGNAVVPWDAHDFFTPSFIALADFTRSGHLMLWNPWMAGGIPDFVEPQLGAFSPLMLATGVVFGGTLLGFRVYFLLVWALSGIGVFLLGRRLRAPAWGAALVAFSWTFSGFLLGHAQHVSWIYSIGCLPLMILLLDQAFERGSWKRFSAVGAVWGVSMLGGYPGIVFNNTLVLAGWALGRTFLPHQAASWGSRPLRHRAAMSAIGLVLVAAVGCAVMAPNLAGMLIEAVGVTSRAGVIAREAAVGNNPFDWWCFSSLASPFLASLPPAKLWPRTDLSMASVYVGALPLILALTAMFTRRASRWGLLLGAIVLLLISLGSATPLRGWLYDIIPFTRYFQHPAMYTGPAMFLVMVLALLGIRDLSNGATPRFLPPLLAAVLSTGAWVALSLVARRAKVAPTPQAWAHFCLAWIGTLVALALYAVLTRRWRRWHPLLTAVMALTTFSDAYLCDKILITHADRRPGIVESEMAAMRSHRDGLDLASMSGLERAERFQPGLGIPGLSAWASVLKTPVLSGYTALRSTEQEIMAQLPATRQIAVGKTKTWFSASAVKAPPSAELFNAFIARSAAVGIPPLAIHDRDDYRRFRVARAEDVAAMMSAPPVSPVDAKLIGYSPTLLDIQVTAPTDGWLLVTDRWAPGWQAEINGRVASLHPADFVFRAVHLEAGTSRIVFCFRPRTLLPTVLLCWGTMAVVLFLQVEDRWRRGRLDRKVNTSPSPTS